MCLTSAWLSALCLCASLATSAQDFPEDDDLILNLIPEDATQPETGTEPGTEFLKCNKVVMIMSGGALKRICSSLLAPVLT